MITNSRVAMYGEPVAKADPLPPIDRTTQPYRIYKPLFLDENHIIRDLDREFESISQALIWVTNCIDIIVPALNSLLPADKQIVIKYPDQK